MRKLILICKSGGKFTPNTDGSLSYCGGDAHAMSATTNTKFDDFREEIAEMWKLDPLCLTIKYFLPNNNRTLITISADKDIERMFEFHEDSATVDVYVIIATLASPDAVLASPDATSLQLTGSNRTTATDYASPFDASVEDIPEIEQVGQQSAPSSLVAIGQRKVLRSWKNCITGIGQQFNGKKEFRIALHKYSLAHGFQHVIKYSRGKRLRVTCKAIGCPWFILLPKLSNTPLFRIKKMNATHNCGAGSEMADCPRPSNKLLASIIKDKLRDTPNTKPMEIVDGLNKEYGIEIDYHQAWSVMKLARKDLLGSHEEAYNQLPYLCEKIIETNPGSAAILVTKEDLSFHRLFIAFHALLSGFQNACRPLLFLNSMGLKSKYQGELLTAIALDGNDGIFPVAFAIVDVLNDENWSWFLVQLKSMLTTSENITFVADGRKETSAIILQIFKNCYHGYCMFHLAEDLKDELKGKFSQEVVRIIVSEFDAAACAPTIDGFKKNLETIKKISQEAYDRVLERDPEQWATSFFKGTRYNHVKSSIVESFYDWFSGVAALPIVQVVEKIRCKMMEWICIRRADIDKWPLKLAPTPQAKLGRIITSSHPIEVSSTPDCLGVYETSDAFGVSNVVKLDDWDCSCKEWKIEGLPCKHAAAVIVRSGKDIYDYCSRYYATETCRCTYMESINPVPAIERLVPRGEARAVNVRPPTPRCSPGRPKERLFLPKCYQSESLKRSLHCSKCKEIGHNKSTCKKRETVSTKMLSMGNDSCA